MITQDEALAICKKTMLTDIEMLQVIQRYIFDRKNMSVGIVRPSDMYSIQLMNIAFNSACDYYFKNN